MDTEAAVATTDARRDTTVVTMAGEHLLKILFIQKLCATYFASIKPMDSELCKNVMMPPDQRQTRFVFFQSRRRQR